MSRKVTVPISMDQELLDMIDETNTDESRSKFISRILKVNFIEKQGMPWEQLIKYWNEECPLDVYFDIMFDYTYLRYYDACYPSDLLSQWGNVDGKYGKIKLYWHEKSVKESIEKIQAETDKLTQELMKNCCLR